jgi:serine-type D-Ala-D-Ala carboxypeptidase (penicillin-binding protein 5/6)
MLAQTKTGPVTRKGRRSAVLAALCFAVSAFPSGIAAAEEPRSVEVSQAVSFAAPRILMIDDGTGTVLVSARADETFAPASFTKLATAEWVFHLIEEGKIALDTPFTVSENAWRNGGAPSGTPTMFAKLGSSINVSDLLRGMLIQGANDAAIILAEGVAGSEEAFVEQLNKRLQDIGIRNTRIGNSTGFASQNAQTNLVDLIRLGRHLRAEHARFMGIFAESEFEWNEILQRNRNPLLDDGLGADGFLTATSDTAGFGLLATAKIGGRRLHLAISGLPDAQSRAAEAKKILQWGFEGFAFSRLLQAEALVGRAEIYGGIVSEVSLAAPKNVDLLLPVDAASLIARIRHITPLQAPVAKGDKVAMLEVWNGDAKMLETPLVAAFDVPLAPLSSRAMGSISELAFGWLR